MKNYSDLLKACSNNNIQEVKYYLSLGDYINGINSGNNIPETPLFMSLKSKNKDIAIFLLENDADPNMSFTYNSIEGLILQ